MEFKVKETPILVEECAYKGVKRIAERVAEDIRLVVDIKSDIMSTALDGKRLILFATIGKSKLLSELDIDLSGIENKRECYQIEIISNATVQGKKIDKLLVVAGSDKRGTIYGMFTISEMIGVTSLVYMGDCLPPKNPNVMLTIDEPIISKEPSIEYRGFFINDEWPAFGNWSLDNFGGVNAKCYEEIFTFLLRMKGNFFWPAMWASVFSEDGPGIDNAVLADELGVVMGTSHHEPLCRAGEEWQRIYKNYSESNAWNFISNRDGITKFWEDGIKRNKDFENLITIGMRGEADSMLLPEDATMADNVQVVKDAILAQHKILREQIDENLKNVPRVLAIYKEVEDYYYGDETCEGLKDWEELKDVTFLLSDDNWANTRGLPKEEERSHPGGYGMYYHFDYHGGPISYEWQNTSRLTKTWEQLTMAYEYGVKKLWIVNVGDVKGNEYPLTYFMDLAYDYEKWSKADMICNYVNQWIDRHFHNTLNKATKSAMLELMEGVTKWNALRKPESLNQYVYDPVNYNEAVRVRNEAKHLLDLAEGLHNALKGNERVAFESLFYYQMSATMNILLMQVEAGINGYLAKLRNPAANLYAECVKKRITDTEQLIDDYNHMLNGKWNHMLDSGFTGLNDWCDKDWGYPVVSYVTPIKHPKIIVSFEGMEGFHLGEHWQDGEPLCNEEFTRPDTKEVVINLDSRGAVPFEYRIECDKEWAVFDKVSGRVDPNVCPRENIYVNLNKETLKGTDKCRIMIYVNFTDGSKTVGKLALKAANAKSSSTKVYKENQNVISISAENFQTKTDRDGEYRVIKYLGRNGSAVKAYPTTKDYVNQEGPYLTYAFDAESEGEYELEIDVLSRNPVVKGENMFLKVGMEGEEPELVNTIKPDYYASHTCDEWCMGVLDNVRRVTTTVNVKKGINRLNIYAASPNVSFDKIVLYKKENGIKPSYLGPVESYTV